MAACSKTEHANNSGNERIKKKTPAFKNATATNTYTYTWATRRNLIARIWCMANAFTVNVAMDLFSVCVCVLSIELCPNGTNDGSLNQT